MSNGAGLNGLAKRIWRESGMKACWIDRRLRQRIAEWRGLRKSLAPVAPPADAPVHMLLIPSDPLLLTDSRGDQAMIGALRAATFERFPGARLSIVTYGEVAATRAREQGAEPVPLASGFGFAAGLARCLGTGATHCIVIGADVLDGAYDPTFSAELIALADLLARSGVRCAINGFSFSDHPHAGLVPLFDEAHESLVFNLRDPVSFSRFRRFSRARARLTADIAFLLRPLDGPVPVAGHADWAAAQRQAGRQILGINIHPLLLELDERHRVPEMCGHFAATIIRLMETRPVSVALLEHDFRGSSSDHLCLDPVGEMLAKRFPGRVHRFARPLDAPEIKRVVSEMSGVITGRMHLAIATLGTGVPVFLIDYKAKMEGLLQHFQVDANVRIVARDLFDERRTLDSIVHFVDKLPALRAQVAARLPAIKEMSRSNLADLFETRIADALH